jgi:transcription antitermination factor NusG
MKTRLTVSVTEVTTEEEQISSSSRPRYLHDTNKQWWVIRVSYGRIYKAREILEKEGAEYYIPLHHIVKKVNGKCKRVIEPLLPSLIFVYTDDVTMSTIIERASLHHHMSYYYDHFSRTLYGKNPPLTVDYKSMMNFIAITSIDNEHIRLVDPSRCHYKAGDAVRITEGEFKGIEGRVARVAGQQRVVVELAGLCMIATAYIPSAFMEPMG